MYLQDRRFPQLPLRARRARRRRARTGPRPPPRPRPAGCPLGDAQQGQHGLRHCGTARRAWHSDPAQCGRQADRTEVAPCLPKPHPSDRRRGRCGREAQGDRSHHQQHGVGSLLDLRPLQGALGGRYSSSRSSRPFSSQTSSGTTKRRFAGKSGRPCLPMCCYTSSPTGRTGTEASPGCSPSSAPCSGIGWTCTVSSDSVGQHPTHHPCERGEARPPYLPGLGP
jgi:hypothetical protein